MSTPNARAKLAPTHEHHTGPLPVEAGWRRVQIKPQGMAQKVVGVDVRPDPNCITCYGRGEVRRVVDGTPTPTDCACVVRRARAFVTDGHASPGPSLVTPPTTATGPSAREATAQRARKELAALTAKRDEALAQFDATRDPLAAAEAEARTARRQLTTLADQFGDEALSHRTEADRLRAEAATHDAAAKLAEDSKAILEASTAMVGAVAAEGVAERACAAHDDERAKVVRHWERRMQPVEARVARAERKLRSGSASLPAAPAPTAAVPA